MIRFGVLVCVFLSVFRKVSCYSTSEGQLIRNITFDNTLPTQTLYYIKVFEGIGLIDCSLQCLRLNPACVGVLYSTKFLSCKLLKCYLDELPITRTNVEVGMGYWFQKNICPVGWVPYDGHCYIISDTKVNWTDAKTQCEVLEARLVEVNTMAENTWILETFITTWNIIDCPNWWDCCETWNGATDIDNEGNFTWNHRTAVDFTNWNEDQPDNFLEESSGDEDGQHCAAFCRNGFWDDNECSKKKTFICEKEHT